MCVIIAKPEGVSITKEELQLCANRNKEGMGFAYIENDIVKICKGFFTFDNFYDEYIRLSNDQANVALLHFRLKTSGLVDKENCHPFMIGSTAFAHNGTMRDVKRFGDMSDSATLAFIIDSISIKFDNPLWVLTEHGIDYLDSYMEFTNKGALLLPDGRFMYLSSSLWHEYKGCKYSNLIHQTIINQHNHSHSYFGKLKNKNTSNFKLGKLCKGNGCKSILRRQIDIDSEYCTHCILKVDNHSWWESQEDLWKGRPEIGFGNKNVVDW